MSAPPSYGAPPRNPDTRELPPGWASQYDEQYKTWFYINTKDGTSHWSNPLGPLGPPGPPPGPSNPYADRNPSYGPGAGGYNSPGPGYGGPGYGGGGYNQGPPPPPPGGWGNGPPPPPPGGWGQGGSPPPPSGGYGGPGPGPGYYGGGPGSGPGYGGGERGWFGGNSHNGPGPGPGYGGGYGGGGGGGYGGYNQQGPPPVQEQPKKGGMGIGTMIAAGGAGLIGGALLENAFEDHDDREYDEGYEQGRDDDYGGAPPGDDFGDGGDW